jgi:hypothetical protein
MWCDLRIMYGFIHVNKCMTLLYLAAENINITFLNLTFVYMSHVYNGVNF